jgi:3-oxoacyl-(acyl-carrier-protein) synthase
MDAGLDSLGAVELRNTLAQSVGMELPGTMVFDYPSVGALAGYLVGIANADDDEEESDDGSGSEYELDSLYSDEVSQATIQIYAALCNGSDGPIAMRLDNKRLIEGLGVVPFTRWDAEVSNLGADPIRFGGFKMDIDHWDSTFFGFPQTEALQTDAQQRNLMSHTYTAMKHAGETVSSIQGSDRSVIVGIASAEYMTISTRVAPITPYTALQGALSVACGRLSYTFGLSGPSYSVDTACSASMVSIHLGSQMLKAEECESSMATGSNLTMLAQTFAILATSKMLTPDGRCKTLDNTADGYVRAEAIGVVLMQCLDEDSEQITLALLRGSAINQDGRSSSLTAPNGPAQQGVIRTSVGVADAPLAQYEEHEMHGTGTSLGDPIEIGATSAVLLHSKVKRGPVTLAAAKPAHGHVEAGAGVVGFLHAITSLTHAHVCVFPTLREMNPYVAETMNIAKLTVASKQNAGLVSTQAAYVTHTGVSAFAYQGPNSHALISRVQPAADVMLQEPLWEMQTLWLTPAAHALAAVASPEAKRSKLRTQAQLSSTTLAFLWQYQVKGVTVLPGAALMELSLAVAQIDVVDTRQAAMMSLGGFANQAPMELSSEVDVLDFCLHLRSGLCETAHSTGTISQVKVVSEQVAPRTSRSVLVDVLLSKLLVS